MFDPFLGLSNGYCFWSFGSSKVFAVCSCFVVSGDEPCLIPALLLLIMWICLLHERSLPFVEICMILKVPCNMDDYQFWMKYELETVH